MNSETDSNIIIRIAARGDGVTADGRHVPLAAPADRLRDDGGLDLGPNHVDPLCQHFPICGGCQLQHLSDNAYADYVRDRVIGALAGQDVPVGEVRPAIVSSPKTRRRAALRAARFGRHFQLGFNGQGSHRVVDMQQCEILHPALSELVAPLRALLAERLPDRRSAQVKMTLVDQGVDILIEGLEASDLASAEALSDFAKAHGLARLSLDNGYGPETRWEPEPLTVTLGGVAVPFAPYSFLQATQEGEGALVAGVTEAVGSAKIVADLFCGLGTFALALSEGRKIYAAEAAREPLMALKAAGGKARRAVITEHRDLFRRPLMAADASKFDAIVLDPPRAGAEEQVRELASSTVPIIAYVSCNPATFARDAKKLVAGGYTLDWVQPVGQFRWSTHIELVGRFSKASS